MLSQQVVSSPGASQASPNATGRLHDNTGSSTTNAVTPSTNSDVNGNLIQPRTTRHEPRSPTHAIPQPVLIYDARAMSFTPTSTELARTTVCQRDLVLRSTAPAFQPNNSCTLSSLFSSPPPLAAGPHCHQRHPPKSEFDSPLHDELKPRLTASKTQVFKITDLQSLLSHRLVAHVRPVSDDVQRHMDAFRGCEAEMLQLDLRGKSAGRVQQDLRRQLVKDLHDGVDEAAFVCKQVGIDSAPRCDQLELMVNAMPGRHTIVFSGPEAKSGLDVPLWQQLHATHCSHGCTADEINSSCYFRVIHHYLLRGYDPQLLPHESWHELGEHKQAYVGAWKKDQQRCSAAWEKWQRDSTGLLFGPVTNAPGFVTPLLPASKSKQVWRYLRDGTPYKIRLCLDLKATKVNDGVADWKFRYRDLHDVAVNLHRDDWLASVDISRFFLRLPAGRGLRQVQWVRDPHTYSSKTPPRWWQLRSVGFGLKTAPAWASVVSAELCRILKAAGVRVVGCFVDDILIAGGSQSECHKMLNIAKSIMSRLGVPANDKTKGPTQDIVFLGVRISTRDMRFTISAEHRDYAVARIREVLTATIASKGDLASIAGVLTWISFVFIPGRPRRQHIYDASRLGSSGSKSDMVRISGPLQRQLRWWLNSLSAKKFTGSRVWDSHASPHTMLLRSDASGEDGWGVCVAGLHIVGPWPTELMDAHMLFKELVPVVIALSLLAPATDETVFGCAVDNTGAAFTLNKLTCRDAISRELMKSLASTLDAYGHTTLAAHIRRDRNNHADVLSHTLPPSLWLLILRHQESRESVRDAKFWKFPFVVQCLSTGKCMSAVFKLRKSS